MPSLGYSFAPTADNALDGRRGGSPSTTAQTALEVLNFQLKKPRVAGAAGGGLSPLQGSQQAGSSIGQAVLNSVLRTVLGSDGASFMPAASGMPQGRTPDPVIHPGDLRAAPPVQPDGSDPFGGGVRAPVFGADPAGQPTDPTTAGGPYEDWRRRSRYRFGVPDFAGGQPRGAG